MITIGANLASAASTGRDGAVMRQREAAGPRSPVRSLQPALFAGEADREPGIAQGIAEAGPELMAQGILPFVKSLTEGGQQPGQSLLDGTKTRRILGLS